MQRLLSRCGSAARHSTRARTQARAAIKGPPLTRAQCASALLQEPVPQPSISKAFSDPLAPSAPLPGGQETLNEVIAVLRTRKGTSQVLSFYDVETVVERGVELARNARLEELTIFAEILAENEFRASFRDLLQRTVSERIYNTLEVEALPLVMRLLQASGSLKLYYVELFDFGKTHLDALNAENLSFFLGAAGEEGLRGKHFVDAGVKRAVALAPEMSDEQLTRTWKGLYRFNRDWREFFQVAQPRMLSLLPGLGLSDLMAVYRTAREMRKYPGFIALHSACATRLVQMVPTLSARDCALALKHSAHSPKFRVQVKHLVESIVHVWKHTEDLQHLQNMEIVEAMTALASWGVGDVALLDKLTDLLVARKLDIKYSPNVSLWIGAADALSRAGQIDNAWTDVVLEFAREKPYLDRVSFFQQCALTTHLARLKVCDELAFKNLAEVILTEVELFKSVVDVAPVLHAYATVNYCHEELFNTIYELMLDWLEAESVDLSEPRTREAWVHAVWSFVVAGYHKKDESFPALLDYAFFNIEPHKEGQHYCRRIAQVADAVLMETPEVAEQCQYTDQMRAVRLDSHVRKIVTSDQPFAKKVSWGVGSVLRQLRYPFQLFLRPDESSLYYMDMSLTSRCDEKVGVIAASRHELFTRGLLEERLPPRPSGAFELVTRLLELRGWRMVVVPEWKWAALPDQEAKRAFVEDLVNPQVAQPALK
uniref:RAP domain-containing protein n=1 Tax=Noctiluca scintillans TaxID=2966 RepID=A0A7S1B281_NOCSC|mmetsp:Transcript_8262/g.22905  ORF Transcript_8262/g.22905 Transcript_8262/m.22905 type:complete len:712 (+) Transcript_8262:62-2197(+)